MASRLIRLLLGPAAVGLLLGLHCVPARAAQSLDGCGGRVIASLPAVIGTQGTWCLNKDLSTGIVSGAAVLVDANNVTIDCNDFKLGGAAAGSSTTAVGILVEGRVGVTIRNCNIRGFQRGVWFDDGASALVENNAFFGNTVIAVGVVGVDSVLVRGNRISDTGNAPNAVPAVIVIISGTGVVVSDNVVSGVVAHPTSGGPAWGIRDESVGSTISGNRLFNIAASGGSDGTGILLGTFGKAIGNTIDNVSGGVPFAIDCGASASAQSNINSRVANAAAISGCADGGGNMSL